MKNYQQTTLILSDLDRKMISELSSILGEKTIIAVIRFSLRETYKNFFGRLCSIENGNNHEKNNV